MGMKNSKPGSKHPWRRSERSRYIEDQTRKKRTCFWCGLYECPPGCPSHKIAEEKKG